MEAFGVLALEEPNIKGPFQSRLVIFVCAARVIVDKMVFSWLVFMLATYILINYFLKPIIGYYWSCYQHPPGPIGLPFFGILLNLIWQGGNFQKRELAEYFGSKYAQATGIFSYMLGARRFIFLHTYDAIKEALCDNAIRFSGRPQSHLEQWFGRGVGGIVLTEGDLWKTLRHFSLKVLHKLGNNRYLLQQQIQLEAQMLKKSLHKSAGRQIQPHELFTRSISNVICHFVFGERWQDDDAEFDNYATWIRTGLQAGGLKNALKFLYPKLSSWRIFRALLCDVDELSRNDQCLEDLIRRKFESAEAVYKSTEHQGPRCFVEAYLHEFEHGAKPIPCAEVDIRYQGVRTCLDLLVAGTETTATILSWTMLFLAQHQAVQDNLHREIDAFLSRKLLDRDKSTSTTSVITYKDREVLPYTLAIMDETQRLSSIVFHGVMHSVDQDCLFRGFLVERDDVIFANLYHVHHDADIWGPDVHQFRPERFLATDTEGRQQYQPSKYLIPFNVGKRICLGERLARMEYFIFLAHIMSEFRVTLTPETSGNLEFIMRGTEGIIHAPLNYKVYFAPRS